MRTHPKGGCDVRPVSEPIPFEMGLQIPCRVCSQAAAPRAVCANPPSIGTDLPCSGPTKGVQDRGKHLMPDHVHMCIAIPPKYPVASVIGFLKGKSAIAVARLSGKERNFTGDHLWARGYAVSTVGFELEQVRRYIRDQEEADGAGQF